MKPPSIDDVRRVLATVDERDPVLSMALHLAAATGMRRGEVCGLRWSGVDFKARAMNIVAAVATTADGLLEKDTKTRQIRKIALDDGTLERLAAHRAAMTSVAAEARIQFDPNAYVVSYSIDGTTPVNPDTLTGAFRRVRKAVGLTNVRLHDLRHAHATELLAAGVPVKSVSQRLGHADASMTLNVYAHALERTIAKQRT